MSHLGPFTSMHPPPDICIFLLPGPKSDLVSLMEGSPEQQLLVPFASLVYARGHNATDYAKWYHSFQPYKIEYQVSLVLGRLPEDHSACACMLPAPKHVRPA